MRISVTGPGVTAAITDIRYTADPVGDSPLAGHIVICTVTVENDSRWRSCSPGIAGLKRDGNTHTESDKERKRQPK